MQREENSGYQRVRGQDEGGREGKVTKGKQIYGDEWKINFAGEHIIGYTKVGM